MEVSKDFRYGEEGCFRWTYCEQLVGGQAGMKEGYSAAGTRSQSGRLQRSIDAIGAYFLCPFSSVVERATRNGEVGCSIQPMGTRHDLGFDFLNPPHVNR